MCVRCETQITERKKEEKVNEQSRALEKRNKVEEGRRYHGRRGVVVVMERTHIVHQQFDRREFRGGVLCRNVMDTRNRAPMNLKELWKTKKKKKKKKLFETKKKPVLYTSAAIINTLEHRHRF